MDAYIRQGFMLGSSWLINRGGMYMYIHTHIVLYIEGCYHAGGFDWRPAGPFLRRDSSSLSHEKFICTMGM